MAVSRTLTTFKFKNAVIAKLRELADELQVSKTKYLENIIESYYLDMTGGYSFCKRGHLKTPNNTTKNGACKECTSIWRIENKDKLKEQKKAYKLLNIEKVRKEHKRYKANNRHIINKAKRNRTESLGAGYIAEKLGLPQAKIPPELLELKRTQLTLHREVKSFKKELKEYTDGHSGK